MVDEVIHLATAKSEAIHVDNVPASNQDVELINYSHDAGELQKQYWGSFRFLGSIAAICTMSTTFFIGYAMPTNLLLVINADLGPSSDIYLVSTIVSLVSGVLLLVVGRISDLVGRRYFFIAGQTFGIVGSIICATAKSLDILIAGTVFLGIAATGQQLYPLLIAELLPNKQRFWGQAGITLFQLPVLGFGPVIARALVVHTKLGWRWCYWINAIVCFTSTALFAACYFPPNFRQIHSRMTKREQFKQFDFLGLLLFSAGMALVLLGFSWGNGTYPWKGAHVIATLVVGGMSLVCFGFYEAYVSLKQPLLPMRLFKIRTLAASFVIGSVAQMAYYALNIFWPMQISLFITTDNITIGWMSCTTGLGVVAGEVIFGAAYKHVRRPAVQLFFLSIMVTVFVSMMSIVKDGGKQSGIAFTFLVGLFFGAIELLTVIVASLVVDPHEIGVAQGLFASVRAVTGTIAATIYTVIYSNRLSTNLPNFVISAAEASGLPSSSIPALMAAIAKGTPAALQAIPGMTNEILVLVDAAVKRAYYYSFRVVFLSSIAWGGLAIIASFFIQGVDQFMTNSVNKTIDQRQIRSEPNLTTPVSTHSEPQVLVDSKEMEKMVP